MTFLKGIGVLAAAFGLVALCAGEAAAQQPTLEVDAIGTTVTIVWSPVAGALAYNVVVTGSANVDISWPASSTRIVATAPVTGAYNVRVRATAGAVAGPFSETKTVTVGPTGGCGQIGGLTATTSTAGGSVQVNWTPVPGTLGYRIEFSRFAGSTELIQTVSADRTSLQQYVGIVGTFYVRVVAGNGCSTSTSPEVSFRIETLAGSGPRTPDPPAGTVLPLPSYGPAVVQAIVNAYRGDLNNSCLEHGGNNTWLFRLVFALRQQDSRWGLNWKRGNVGDMSQDIVTYNYGSGADEGTTDVYIIDTISGHCGDRPDWNWGDVTGATRAGGGIGRWTLVPYLRAGLPADSRQ